MTVKEYNKGVEQYSDNIYRFVLKNIKDTEKAKDIVQDTFEKVWKNHKDISYAKVKSYLFSTAYHTLIDAIRREKYKAEWDKADDNKYYTNQSYSDLNEVLHQVLDMLPPDQKNVILLRDYEGYSYKEIADITQLSEAQVKVYIYRGRQFLKNYIGKIEVLV
ncbi:MULTISPECIES: RNA polymerase sigma factor [unclassified Saccharicrinis]|uniref:RNA polymerase sigma factor n=1 Tax=unclassified Saccharicrinis TaxID=2646859 RepID=UPI003D339623